MSSELIGIIPAAGLGTRMGPLTREMPKALIEIEGKPLLERATDTLKSIGVSKVVVVVGYRGEMVRDFVSTRDLGVDITFAIQPRQLGLAHAISVAADQITTDFVVLCPDNIFSEPDDLGEAKDIFIAERPALLMVATVSPTHQRDRAKYSTSALPKIASHLYGYRPVNNSRGGVALTSTGCTFFSHPTLGLLPSFDDITAEHKFGGFVDQIAERHRALLYLLRGTRHDLSQPDDISGYCEFREKLKASRGQGVSAILLNAEGKVLLQHRDDNPNIRYPGHWGLFGGSIDPGETPYAAAKREILEETGHDIPTLALFREFIQNNKREFAFVGEISPSLTELKLNEGQGMDFVSPSELGNLLLRPDDAETLKTYFGI